MNIVAWARVSSREQAEGYSLDAQMRAIRERALRDGWKIVREFSVTESARRGAEREQFNAMMEWLKSNAKRDRIGALVCHKIDRAARNMRDFARLKDVEESLGVKLVFTENQFGGGAAGELSFNVLASVSQFYSDNLKDEVAKGMNAKLRDGWIPGNVPFGYRNGDKERGELPVVVVPGEAETVRRAFALFSCGDTSIKMLRSRLYVEGRFYTIKTPRFPRSTLSTMLRNPFYTGLIVWKGKEHEGKHEPVIDAAKFRTCQDVLAGRERRVSEVNLPLAGGLIRCGCCNQAITGERIKKRLRNGDVNHHCYYRCCHPDVVPNHPRLRWRADALEESIVNRLGEIAMPLKKAEWLQRRAHRVLAGDKERAANAQAVLKKRATEIKGMKSRLLKAFVLGAVEEPTFQSQNAELSLEQSEIEAKLGGTPETIAGADEIEAKVFRLTQNAAEIWLGSNTEVRRDLLDALCLNRRLTDVTLDWEWRYPFDVMARCTNQGSGGG